MVEAGKGKTEAGQSTDRQPMIIIMHLMITNYKKESILLLLESRGNEIFPSKHLNLLLNFDDNGPNFPNFYI